MRRPGAGNVNGLASWGSVSTYRRHSADRSTRALARTGPRSRATKRAGSAAPIGHSRTAEPARAGHGVMDVRLSSSASSSYADLKPFSSLPGMARLPFSLDGTHEVGNCRTVSRVSCLVGICETTACFEPRINTMLCIRQYRLPLTGVHRERNVASGGWMRAWKARGRIDPVDGADQNSGDDDIK
jgi:hypothetical protein